MATNPLLASLQTTPQITRLPYDSFSDLTAIISGQPRNPNHRLNTPEVQRLVNVLRLEGISTAEQMYALNWKATQYDGLLFVLRTVVDNLLFLLLILAEDQFGRWIAAVKEAHGATVAVILSIFLNSLVPALASTSLQEATEPLSHVFALPPIPDYGGPESSDNFLYESVVILPISLTLVVNLFLLFIMALYGPFKSSGYIKLAVNIALVLKQRFDLFLALMRIRTPCRIPHSHEPGQDTECYVQRWLQGKPSSACLKIHLLNRSTPFSFCCGALKKYAQKVLTSLLSIFVTTIVHPRSWATCIVLIPSSFLTYFANVEADKSKTMIWQGISLLCTTGTKTNVALLEWQFAKGFGNRWTAANAQKVGKDTQTAVGNLTKTIMQKAADVLKLAMERAAAMKAQIYNFS